MTRVAADRSGRLERALPGDLAQRAAVADERARHPLIDMDRLVGEAPLVAQPAVVDLDVVAREHAHDLLVTHREADVALRRAQRADAACVLDVPWTRAEPVRLARERPDGTQFDDVAAERGDIRVAVVGADERVRAALGEDQLPVFGDLLAEPHAEDRQY